MADKVVYPAIDNGTPIWATGSDRLVDPDGNPLGASPGSAIARFSGISNTAGNGSAALVTLTAAQLTAAVKWLRIQSFISTNGWPSYFAAGTHVIDVRSAVNWLIWGIGCGSAAPGAQAFQRAGAILGAGASLAIMNNIGQLANQYVSVVNPATRALTITAQYTVPGVQAQSVFIEAFG